MDKINEEELDIESPVNSVLSEVTEQNQLPSPSSSPISPHLSPSASGLKKKVKKSKMRYVNAVHDEEKTFPTEEKDAMKYISKFTRKYLNEIKNSGKMITKDQFKQIVEKASEKVLKEFLNKQRKKEERGKSTSVVKFLNVRRKSKVRELVDKYLKRVSG